MRRFFLKRFSVKYFIQNGADVKNFVKTLEQSGSVMLQCWHGSGSKEGELKMVIMVMDGQGAAWAAALLRRYV